MTLVKGRDPYPGPKVNLNRPNTFSYSLFDPSGVLTPSPEGGTRDARSDSWRHVDPVRLSPFDSGLSSVLKLSPRLLRL